MAFPLYVNVNVKKSQSAGYADVMDVMVIASVIASVVASVIAWPIGENKQRPSNCVSHIGNVKNVIEKQVTLIIRIL